MADTKFIDLDVIKRLYNTLRGIINANQQNNEAVITDISTRADKALSKSNTLENEAKNYATKEQLEQHKNSADSKYATKDELKVAIGGVSSVEFKIVSSLPSSGSEGIMYLIRNSASSGDNIYNEYIWVSQASKFERVGSMDIDLSGYLTKTSASSTYATKNELSTGLSGKSNTGHTHSYAGSSSVGGVATSAEKLTKSAGNTTQPIYFLNGAPVATTYSLNKSVPSDAKFTDTTYGQASSSVAGIARLYSSKGQNTDGSMTQKAISDAISTGVSGGTSGSAVNDSDGNPINTTYLKKTSAESTYLSKTSASSTYLTKTDASSTYLAKTGTAAKATADGDGNSITDTYLKKASADNMYLTKNSAMSTYLDLTSAQNNYLGKSATAAAATKLSTARNIRISGSVSGSASFDGSGDVTINTKVQYGTSAPASLSDGVLYCVIEN